jgi:hypothetical protein
MPSPNTDESGMLKVCLQMEVRLSLTITFKFGASNFKNFKQFYHMPKCVGVAPRSLDVGDAPASHNFHSA